MAAVDRLAALHERRMVCDAGEIEGIREETNDIYTDIMETYGVRYSVILDVLTAQKVRDNKYPDIDSRNVVRLDEDDYVAAFKSLGIHEFTMSAQVTAFAAVLYMFCQCGCTIDDVTVVNTYDYWKEFGGKVDAFAVKFKL